MGGVCIIGCLPDKFSARLKKVVLKFGWVNNMAIAPNSTEIIKVGILSLEWTITEEIKYIHSLKKVFLIKNIHIPPLPRYCLSIGQVSY